MGNKELRLSIFNKYNGKCAYCGNDIEIKNMQVDHIFPQSRKHFLKSDKMKEIYNIKFNNINDIDNLNPSCRRCNHYKRALTLKEYRELIKTLHERVLKQYINKVAVDYGIIKLNKFNGTFYFETLKDKQ